MSGHGPEGLAFSKGHGTENDFVLLPDPDGALDLSPALVRAICDRRAGIGADGVLRVVRVAAAGPEVAGMAGQAEWFMDYRNADGSLAQMCGNGARVFAHYLAERGWVQPGGAGLPLATRGGVRRVRWEPDDQLTVDLGAFELPEVPGLRVRVGERSWAASAALLPNPHAVVLVPESDLDVDLSVAPLVTPTETYPDGVNIEFVVRTGPSAVRMRVHERGVGETRSCGTGACAAALVARRAGPTDPPEDRTGGRAGGRADDPLRFLPATMTVDVPGGRLHVTETIDGRVELTGPAEIVGSGVLSPAWTRRHR